MSQISNILFDCWISSAITTKATERLETLIWVRFADLKSSRDNISNKRPIFVLDDVLRFSQTNASHV